MEAPAARLLLKAANAETAEHVGIRTLKILVMVNTRKNSRGNKDQVISSRNAATAAGRRAPGPAYVWFFQDHQWKQRYDPSAKQQAPVRKPHAPIFRRQASSGKPQASSAKRQASQPE